MIDTTFLPPLLAAIQSEILNNEAEISALDRAIGDGDHVTNLLRGLEALTKQNDELVQLDWSAAFMKMGMTLMSTMGGASGSLLGSMFVSMGKAAKDRDMDLTAVSTIYSAGVESIKARGKADIGEKTMLDTLIPVMQSLQSDAKKNADKAAVLSNMKTAATQGMQSTKDMLATKGRASFLGERARGHIDAGARTSQLILCVIADELSKN
ncbi:MULTISPECIES: dihydroxyacetone kinase subunit DhaL [unclassified Methylophaga]|jgi:dihydroxyacetone kinase-like protein|uniref:dihydroxyacetone kinase subunit DhaL n=1 Tax=unclassified Methylophaga TaxID=2629249 RepID=UPI00259C6E2F|nr:MULTISPECIES: dihydroxyacetone kinase subunit DhaL [unclassified Methylophaga]|tara:strand:- start:5309 stop:5938 length:630 start_codon:yes stop_codon:yes gene_type:complete